MTPAANTPDIRVSSRDIAAAAEKRHDNVMRDIRKILADLEIAAVAEGASAEAAAEKFGLLKFEGTYFDSQNKQKTEYLLPKDLALTLASGYSTVLRHKIVQLINQLQAERASTPAFQLPDFTNPAVAARAWADEVEAKTKAQAALELAREDQAALHAVTAAATDIGVREAGKMLGVGQNVLVNWLIDNGWMNRDKAGRLFAYATHDTKGKGWLRTVYSGPYDHPETGEEMASRRAVITADGIVALVKAIPDVSEAARRRVEEWTTQAQQSLALESRSDGKWGRA